jgi:hypothetical protein
MALFDAQLGARPDQSQDRDGPQARLGSPKPVSPTPIAGTSGPGPQPAVPQPQAQPAPSRDQPGRAERLERCPLCQAPLGEDAGLWRCQDTCGALWLEIAPGTLVDLAQLPYGTCACCRPPRALARSSAGAICPASGHEYLLLPEGPRRAEHAAPHGRCLCCIPPMPLIVEGERLVCQSRRYNQYVAEDGRIRAAPAPKPGASTEATLAAIDAALRQNAARVTIHGLFDLDE